MKLAAILVIGLICAGTFAFAQTDPLPKESPKLGITLDATWVSKYIWHGQDLYDDHAAFQPSIDLDLFGTGFSVNVWESSACSDGFVDSEELDYSVAYENSFFKDSAFKTDYEIRWLYYDYFRISSDKADAQEFDFSFSWPEILPFGLTPTYMLSYLYAATDNSPASQLEMEGAAHTVGFTWDVNEPQTKLPLTFIWNITYNDGQGGSEFAHDWSYITWGLSTSFNVGPGSFTPAIYYQTSMENSLNTEDELWTSLSYSLSF
ncbi:MAG: TorF family putative porin [Phycisphaerae bacterium]|jgi:hypothetical protein